MVVCEFRKRHLVPVTKHKPDGGLRVLCDCNGLPCLVDSGDPTCCTRFAWVKRVQQKTAQLVKVQEELTQLAIEGMPDHG